jgi:hypothetical protein
MGGASLVNASNEHSLFQFVVATFDSSSAALQLGESAVEEF